MDGKPGGLQNPVFGLPRGDPTRKAEKWHQGDVFNAFWTGSLAATRICFFGCSWGTLHGKLRNGTRGASLSHFGRETGRPPESGFWAAPGGTHTESRKMSPGDRFQAILDGKPGGLQNLVFWAAPGGSHTESREMAPGGRFYGILDGKPGGLQNPVFGVLLGGPTGTTSLTTFHMSIRHRSPLERRR